MEWSILHTLNDFLFHHDAVEDPISFYINASEALFAATLVVVFLVAHGPRLASWRRATVAAALSAGLALAVGKVISELVDRARPFVAEPHQVHLFTAHAADPGFPSDHATAAFAIATAIVLRKRGWGIVMLVAAALLSVGRVAIGIHYPSDVVAGAALGAIAAGVLYIPWMREKIDALSDLLGGALDRLVDRGRDLIAPSRSL
jgi:undecaprenyl-diphosphatase